MTTLRFPGYKKASAKRASFRGIDYDSIKNSLEAQLRTLYDEHFPNGMPTFNTKALTKEEVEALREPTRLILDVLNAARYRIVRLKNKVVAHQSWIAKRRARIDYIASNIEELLYGIDAGKVFVSFDIERCVKDITREIGITIYRSATGEIESHNYRVTKIENEYFAYGKTEILPLDDLYARLIEVANEADFYVGHSLTVDLDHLGRRGIVLPEVPVLDTHLLSSRIYGNESLASLVALVEHFVLGSFRPHNGGNDARMTLEVLLSMGEYYRARPHLLVY